jgi:adenylate cyclase
MDLSAATDGVGCAKLEEQTERGEQRISTMYQNDRGELVKALRRLAEAHYATESTASAVAEGMRRDSDFDADVRSLLEYWAPVQRPAPIEPTTATILLSDVRGFTELMAAYPAPMMVDLLNRYFSVMCDSVERYGGRIDKFMGDSVMAVFGVPETREDDLERALACAVDMQQGMVRLNQGHSLRGEPEMHAGIALSTGPVMAGTFGPARYGAFTVMGDAVNLASRIESFSLRGQVLISDAVHEGAASFVEVGPANRVCPKGVLEPVTLFPLRAVQYKGRFEVPSVEPRKSPRVKVDLDALFRQVQAKRLADNEFAGQVKDIGYFGLSAELPEQLPDLAELAIEFPQAGRQWPGYLYARVLRATPAGTRYRTSLEFTALDTPAHRAVKSLVDDRLWHR